MRSYVFVLVSVYVSMSVVACSEPGDGSSIEAEPAFEITSSPITLAPGEETTKCFYFTTSNAESVAVAKWVSDMTDGSHHMIYFRTLAGSQPADGTVDEACGGDGAITVPVYGTQIPHEELAFPTDDGNGKAIGQLIESGSKGFLQMHYFNASDQPLTTTVSLKAYPLKADVEYTRTDIFATYNNDISIPPGATNFKVSATCGVVDGQFFTMSSHSHKQSIATAVRESDAMLFTSNDWEHPGSTEFAAPVFYQFGSGELTWECTYNNTGDNAARTVRAGSSAKTDEMCMMTGYYFPAIGPRGCVMDGGECQCLL